MTLSAAFSVVMRCSTVSGLLLVAAAAAGGFSAGSLRGHGAERAGEEGRAQQGRDGERTHNGGKPRDRAKQGEHGFSFGKRRGRHSPANVRASGPPMVNAAKGARLRNTHLLAMLAEFQSVVDALDYAVKMQEAIAVANEQEPTEHRLLFRIGINVGDVMVKDGDIVGDGVNIAARLETLAEPGGICISRGVRDHVRKMGQYAFQDLGEHTVKNICPADPPSASAARTVRCPYYRSSTRLGRSTREG